MACAFTRLRRVGATFSIEHLEDSVQKSVYRSDNQNRLSDTLILRYDLNVTDAEDTYQLQEQCVQYKRISQNILSHQAIYVHIIGDHFRIRVLSHYTIHGSTFL